MRIDRLKTAGAGLAAAALSALMLATLAPQPAAAQRPDLRRMTCNQAQDLVARRGAVVMTTGQHTYERFVAGPRWCDHWETVRPAQVRTRDTSRCIVGYICETPLFSPWERRGGWR